MIKDCIDEAINKNKAGYCATHAALKTYINRANKNNIEKAVQVKFFAEVEARRATWHNLTEMALQYADIGGDPELSDEENDIQYEQACRALRTAANAYAKAHKRGD